MEQYEQPPKDSESAAFEALARELDGKLKAMQLPVFKQGVDALFAMEAEDFKRLLSDKHESDSVANTSSKDPEVL